MMSGRKRQPPKGSPQPEPDEKKSSVHIVFVATVDTKTGGMKSRNIIGIFDDVVEAKQLETKFNQQEKKVEGIVVKAFTTRYALPYVAPAVKHLLA